MCIRDSGYSQEGYKKISQSKVKLIRKFAEETGILFDPAYTCLLYTSDAADERSSVDLGGRRIIKKKNNKTITLRAQYKHNKNKKHINKTHT